MNAIKKPVVLGLVTLFMGLCLVGILLFKFFETIQRYPSFPVEELLSQQKMVLNESWVYQTPETFTDDDFTWAKQVILTSFSYKEGLAYISEEFHIFPNPLISRIIKSPSPLSVFSGNYFVPKRWNYSPKYADSFQLGCFGGDLSNNPDNCLIVAQYYEYRLVMYLPIREYMSLEEMEDFFRITDEYMNEYLKKSKVRTKFF